MTDNLIKKVLKDIYSGEKREELRAIAPVVAAYLDYDDAQEEAILYGGEAVRKMAEAEQALNRALDKAEASGEQ